jgi:biotin carboxyl carrier protein
MKYVVKVAGQCFEVEIEDLYARPIIARVDGQEFKVSPEDSEKLARSNGSKEITPVELTKKQSDSNPTPGELTAPLPGTVIELFAKTGDTVEAGQVLLVIEAMKMKNSIRSTRAGTILEVLVNAGETVAHKQALVRFR